MNKLRLSLNIYKVTHQKSIHIYEWKQWTGVDKGIMEWNNSTIFNYFTKKKINHKCFHKENLGQTFCMVIRKRGSRKANFALIIKVRSLSFMTSNDQQYKKSWAQERKKVNKIYICVASPPSKHTSKIACWAVKKTKKVKRVKNWKNLREYELETKKLVKDLSKET